MGKAVIMSHIGDGKYSILYKRDNSRAKQRLTELEDLKTALDEEYYGRMLGMKTTADLNYAGASQKFFWALDDWAACAMQVPACDQHEALMAAVKERAKERTSAASAVTTINGHIAKNRADHYSAVQEIGYISSTAQTTQDGDVIEAWCISHDPELVIPVSTTVGTIETYGAVGDAKGGWLPKKYINIAGCDMPDYSCGEHNRVVPTSSTDAASWAMNYMQWLYVMANNPRFAVGTLTAKNDETDVGTVVLYGNTPNSSAPSKWPFSEGYSVTLTDIPIVYLECNARSFEADDRVVVSFSAPGRSGPVVIGFADNPQPCQKVTLTYIAGANGKIWYLGEYHEQVVVEVMLGDDGPFIVAAPSYNYKFSAWTPGGITTPQRRDLDVTTDATYTVSFEYAAWAGVPPLVMIEYSVIADKVIVFNTSNYAADQMYWKGQWLSSNLEYTPTKKGVNQLSKCFPGAAEWYWAIIGSPAWPSPDAPDTYELGICLDDHPFCGVTPCEEGETIHDEYDMSDVFKYRHSSNPELEYIYVRKPLTSLYGYWPYYPCPYRHGFTGTYGLAISACYVLLEAPL